RLTAIVLLMGSWFASAQNSGRSIVEVLNLTPNQMAQIRNRLKPVAKADADAIIGSIITAQKSEDPSIKAQKPEDPNFGNLTIEFLKAAMEPKMELKNMGVFTAMVETSRTDKQAGASFSGSGSLNTVDRPGIPSLLGFAIQH